MGLLPELGRGYQGQQGTEMVHKPPSPSAGLGSAGPLGTFGAEAVGRGIFSVRHGSTQPVTVSRLLFVCLQ